MVGSLRGSSEEVLITFVSHNALEAPHPTCPRSSSMLLRLYFAQVELKCLQMVPYPNKKSRSISPQRRSRHSGTPRRIHGEVTVLLQATEEKHLLWCYHRCTVQCVRGTDPLGLYVWPQQVAPPLRHATGWAQIMSHQSILPEYLTSVSPPVVQCEPPHQHPPLR